MNENKYFNITRQPLHNTHQLKPVESKAHRTIKVPVDKIRNKAHFGPIVLTSRTKMHYFSPACTTPKIPLL